MRALTLLAGLFFLMLITPASAIGISPGRTEISFIPNFEGDFSFIGARIDQVG